MAEFHPSYHGFSFTTYFTRLPSLPDLPQDIDSEIEDMNVEYGLCGGMALAARDFYLDDRPIPARESPPDSGPLFDYLWQRQLDTFDRDNTYQYLRKFVQFYLPTTFTRARSVDELSSLKQSLDRGRPSVLGLVYVRAGDGNLWDNHQVLAFDYTESGDTTRINVYDPNCPGENNIEVRVTVKDQAWSNPAPGDEKIDAEQYRGASQMENVIGVIHMDVSSQTPPQNL